MGIFTKRVPAIAAKIALISSVILYLIAISVLDTHFLDIMFYLFCLNIIIMIIGSWVAPKKDEYIPKVTEAIDVTPWKYTIIAGIVIAILVIGTYIVF